MYNVNNPHYYKIWDGNYQEFIDYCYSDEELIKFIARYYHENYLVNMADLVDNRKFSNKFIDYCACSSKDKGYKRYQIFDNYNRIINVKDYADDAFALWKKQGQVYDYWWHFKKKIRSKKYRQHLKDYSNYRFRKDPVPGTRKRRGGPWWSPPHTAGIKRIYANPAYKGFNRGSFHGIPDWWDDRYRCVQKNWKEQRKVRHQWQR